MTKEESVQLALGTLPLWRRMELGLVEFIEEHNENSTVSSLSHPDVPGRYMYKRTVPGAREEVINLLIATAKENKI